MDHIPDENPKLVIERDDAVVRIELRCKDIYTAMLLYDDMVSHAVAGELRVTFKDVDIKRVVTGV